MIHKNKRTEAEWWLLHPRLQLILSDANLWCYLRGARLVITGMIRGDLEQWALWKKGLSSEKSVHQIWSEFGCGVDTRPLSNEELNQQLLDHINQRYVYDLGRRDMKTLIRHKGTADHVHWQVRPGS